jgi:hypothetical protein
VVGLQAVEGLQAVVAGLLQAVVEGLLQAVVEGLQAVVVLRLISHLIEQSNHVL